MSRSLSADVAIIGGGLVGSSAALALRRSGFSVVLLDKGFAAPRRAGSITAACAGKAVRRRRSHCRSAPTRSGRA